MRIGDRVRIKDTTDDDHRGRTGQVVETWPAGGEFQVGVKFPEDATGESWSYAQDEVELA